MKIMTGSYNETVATQFSKGVRNSIMEQKADLNRIVYSDIFPGVRIKKGDGASNLWSLEGGFNNYLATSPGGTATGFGADILIIDDVIKNAEEANNATILEDHWSWFNNTILSRLERGSKIIIVMTRWHSKDLAGRILETMPENGYRLKHINMKAMQDDGTMLCDDILSHRDYTRKIASMGEDIASANYQQEPIDIKGRLYTNLQIYHALPRDAGGYLLFEDVGMYCDTADEGDDYLCAIVYGKHDGKAYVLDVLYTKDPMEITEPATAQMAMDNRVNTIIVESNSGGRGFARAVNRHLEEAGYTRAKAKWFHQTRNKRAKILTNATAVMQNIFFPARWKDRWPDFYESMRTFQAEGTNQHDDAQDALSEIADIITKPSAFSFE